MCRACRTTFSAPGVGVAAPGSDGAGEAAMFWEMAACLRFLLGAGTGVGAVDTTTAGGDGSRGSGPDASILCRISKSQVG